VPYRVPGKHHHNKGLRLSGSDPFFGAAGLVQRGSAYTGIPRFPLQQFNPGVEGFMLPVRVGSLLSPERSNIGLCPTP